MKYLKRYNEELEPNTYKKAGEVLRRLGHTKRGDKLISWGEDVRKKEEDRNTIKRMESASKLGTYKMKLIQKKSAQKNITSGLISPASENIILEGNFFIHFYIDEDDFKASYDMWEDQGESFSLPFQFGIIPADKETRIKLIDIVGEEELYLNTFYINYMYIQLSDGNYGCDTYSYIDENGNEIIDNDKVCLNPKGELHFEPFSAGGLIAYFGDRKSAVQFKKMIIDLFEGRIVYGDTNENPGGIKEYIMDELCSERDRSLEEFESIIKSLKKININKLYKD